MSLVSHEFDREGLARGGGKLPGRPESDGTWTWLTFRMPDGNIHSLGARTA